MLILVIEIAYAGSHKQQAGAQDGEKHQMTKRPLRKHRPRKLLRRRRSPRKLPWRRQSPSRFERWILGLLPLVGEALIPVEPGVQIGRADALPELLSSGRHGN